MQEHLYRRRHLSDDIIYVDDPHVKCTGQPYPNNHPAVFYVIPPGGTAVCRYCEQKFRLKDAKTSEP